MDAPNSYCPTPHNRLGLRFQGIALAMAFGLLVGSQQQAAGQAVQQGGIAALRNAEQGLADVIAAVEPSIVAISHSPPQKNAARRPTFLQFGNDPFRGKRRAILGADEPMAVGAGVVIGEGLVLTQSLAIEPGDEKKPEDDHFVTTIEGERLAASIKAADPRSGLAVLEVPGLKAPALKTGKAEALRKGSLVVALGNPYAVLSDGQPTASFGTITNLGRKLDPDVNLNNSPSATQSFRTTLHHYGTLLQTDARLGWNASGGALVNLEGELVGITTTASMIAGHEQPAGYAIPLNKIFRRVVDTLKEGREVEYGLIGISFRPESVKARTVDRPGIAVDTTYSGSPADRAGLRSGDIITEINELPITNPDELQLAVGSLPPDTPTPIRFERRGQPREAMISLAKYYVGGKKVVTNKPAPWRGIRVDYSTALPAEEMRVSGQQGAIDPLGCVLVAEVEPESTSWRAGVRPGMFISHVGEERVTTPREFLSAVKNADESVKLRFTKQKPAAAVGAAANRAIPQAVPVPVPRVRPRVGQPQK